MKTRSLALTVVLMIAVAAIATSPAVGAAYIQFEGIKGEMTDKNHEAWSYLLFSSDAGEGSPRGETVLLLWLHGAPLRLLSETAEAKNLAMSPGYVVILEDTGPGYYHAVNTAGYSVTH